MWLLWPQAGKKEPSVHTDSRFIQAALQHKTRGEDAAPQRDETHPNGPKQTSSPGITLASCCAFKGTLPRGISGARHPTAMVVIIPEEQTYRGEILHGGGGGGGQWAEE